MDETVRRGLPALLREGTGAPAARVQRALAVLTDDLGMDAAAVSRLGALHPGDLLALSAVAAYVAEVRGGEVHVGRVDGGEMHGGGDTPARLGDVPSQRTGSSGGSGRRARDTELRGVASTLAAAGDSVEELTRPLLELLGAVTGLESTYLTVVDWDGGTQRIVYSHSTGALRIDEGLTVDWSDTLCRRSLDEGRRCTTDVPAVWGDSAAARDLGIVTYVSVPVHDGDEAVVGTLCAASSRSADVDPADLDTMDMFARLISGQLAREAARAGDRRRAADLEARTRELGDLARRDSLTGLLNRAGVHAWLPDALAGLRPGRDQLAVAYLDVDRFKSVNDTLGHGAGDAVLCALATSLVGCGRVGDLHARLGGDEFVVAGILPAGGAVLGDWTSRLRRAAIARVGDLEVRASLGVVSISDPSVTVAETLAAADAAMYADKAAARTAGSVPARCG